MRPAQLTPENPVNGPSSLVSTPSASMRPAQLTPENRLWGRSRNPSTRCFNEAGAINAGKQTGPPDDLRRLDSFNEAGAINAGKLQLLVRHSNLIAVASMRPAQLTPENDPSKSKVFLSMSCFNEAGAINAGKPGHRRSSREDGGVLQ